MAIFKIYQYNSVQLTDSNAYFVAPTCGSDTNSGLRSTPLSTFTKANTLARTYNVLTGSLVENVSTLFTRYYIGDTSESIINGNVVGTNDTNIQIVDNINVNGNVTLAPSMFNCIINSYSAKSNIDTSLKNCTVKDYISAYNSSSNLKSNNTILRFKNYTASSSMNAVTNFIFIENVDLYNYTSRSTTTYYPIFKYCLFRKLTVWKWNGTTITINWTTNPNTSVAYTTETLLERVYQSLLYYANSLSAGTDKTYFLAILASLTTMFYADANGQTNKVVDDVTYPIFNLYNGTTPVDYSLKLDANNVALTMSATGSYVGAYKANLGGVLFGSIVNVNTDGTDDAVTTPTLLVSDGYNQFSANDASTQSRNRIRTIVQSYPRGKSNAGAGSQLASGLASRIYFGKKRPMVTSGSGLTIPVESFEVIPYDSLPADNSVGAANDITGKSAFPRFSQSFNGTTQMWYKANGTPLLFNDLATYSITTDVSLTEYGTWAVTSADAEDYNLSLIATANSLTKKNIPVTYCKQELNINYV